MPSKPESPSTDPLREAEILVQVAKELQVVADEARERARAACERANTLPLLERMRNRAGQ
jgi:hypothetical protein